ncbi:hypothetical protein C2S53_011785 [Perilla frutescens var. hirtella]|uniref:Uncharacterized protein n=1 Tax=Perilla frutescens var. hirtella TaxID=608512 RepID=A0AAD4P2B1_PERFH|nr:hypothetical protein C2S53_011785 [Perilla frutescens var. hirtella]
MDYDFDSAVQKQLDEAMPWVGLYIAAASAVCTLAIAADAVNGFRQKKLWFPCKYTSLNAASLTVLAVAMKLPMDLNTVMIKSHTDSVAKFASIFFLSTTVSNFMPSLGSMNDKEVLANFIGLGILVIAIMGNVGIQIIELQRFLKRGAVIVDIMIPSVVMLVSLTTCMSLAVTVSTMKRGLKSMYEEKQKPALEEEEIMLCGDSGEANYNFKIDDQRRHMMKYWVMAESSNPQFVMARSVVCTTSAMICGFSYFILASVSILDGSTPNAPAKSAYGIYTKWIVHIQATGQLIAIIVAMLRWFTVVMCRCSSTSSNSFKTEINIEDYWIQTLKDWRDGFSGLEIGANRWWKYVLDVKWCVLTFCIGLQIFIVLVSKILVFFSAMIVSPFQFFFSHIKKLVRHAPDSFTDAELNLSRYVLLLDGEAELPIGFVKSMCRKADNMIQTGRKKQPSSLVNLLQKSVNFNGVGQFNNRQIPSLLCQDPPNCWTLPVVTLTSIAIALPNIAQHQRKQLLSSVSEGLSLAKIVEKTLDTRAQLKHIRKVASATWVELLLYSKWLDIDLTRAFLSCKNSDEVLQELANRAEGMVMEFKRGVHDPIVEENPINWPLKVVAANSMYIISNSILMSSSKEETTEEMLERLSVMIADILAACLTNLPYAITKMCHQNSIEKREKRVREAFLLLGKTEKVVELVRQQGRPFLDNDKATYIEEWRAVFQHDEVASASTWSDECNSEKYLDIIVDC